MPQVLVLNCDTVIIYVRVESGWVHPNGTKFDRLVDRITVKMHTSMCIMYTYFENSNPDMSNSAYLNKTTF